MARTPSKGRPQDRSCLAGERRRPSFNSADRLCAAGTHPGRYLCQPATHRRIGAAGACARWSEHRLLPSGTTFTSPIIPDGSYRIGGAALGAGVGYDWQFDRAVLGLEADFSWVGARGNGWCGFPFALPHGCGGGVTSLGTVRGKLGYEIGNIGVPLLAYVTGGFAFGGIRGWDGLLGGSGTKTAVGWTLGGGLEALVAPNWSVKLEYLYTDLGNRGTFYAVPPNMERLRTTLNVIRVGLNYRFGGVAPKPVVAKY